MHNYSLPALFVGIIGLFVVFCGEAGNGRRQAMFCIFVIAPRCSWFLVFGFLALTIVLHSCIIWWQCHDHVRVLVQVISWPRSAVLLYFERIKYESCSYHLICCVIPPTWCLYNTCVYVCVPEFLCWYLHDIMRAYRWQKSILLRMSPYRVIYNTQYYSKYCFKL